MKYSLGLDLGITSVGWAVIDLDRQKIERLGVRIFEGAENPKDGSSLAAPRRKARGARRRLRRKRIRMANVKQLITDRHILTEKEMEELYTKSFITTPWELRAMGLERELTGEELARVMVHIAKHRGFKSNRTISPEELKKLLKGHDEEGKAKAGMAENSRLLKEGNDGKGYRAVGEMIYNDAKFSEHKRNKAGDYQNTIKRDELVEEVKVLFDKQREFGNPFTTKETEEDYIKIFTHQLPFATEEQIANLVGFCKLEPACKRAVKASWTAERFVLLSRLVNLRIVKNGIKEFLTGEEAKAIEKLAYKQAKVTYKQIRKAINLDEDDSFAYLPFKKTGNPEDAVFAELKGYHTLRKAVMEEIGEAYWNTIISTKPETLDYLATALTHYKTDEDITKYLVANGIEEELIKAVLTLNFTGHINISLEAAKKLIPFMEKGCTYDEACTEAGYLHTGNNGNVIKSLKLPVPDQDEIRNPVVFRAVTQARKVINAITREYGAPYSVQIELARDLSRDMNERREIEKRQGENRCERSDLRKEFEDKFHRFPTASELEKFRYWKDQGNYCVYSGKYIDPEKAFCSDDGNYAEIDHIIPYSRSFDDSYTNKVLVLGDENRNKGNRTPYEYFGEGARWEQFKLNVQNCIHRKDKRNRLLLRSFKEREEREMKERNLNDTRWITKYVAQWLENNLEFAEGEDKKRVHRINGRATAVLRHHWGVNSLKNREESDIHHAVDACVIACATEGMIKKISDYSRRRELKELKTDAEHGKRRIIEAPWKNFRRELEARIAENPSELLTVLKPENYTEEEIAGTKPVFISRAPVRKAHGAAHEETIRSAKYLEEGKTAVKTSLSKIKLDSLENMVDKQRNRALYETLKKRLEENGNKPEKAFATEIRMPTKSGEPGPVIRSIKLWSSGTSGVPVCNGIAANGSMVKIEIYEKDKKFYIIPYYIDDIAKKLKKTKAVVKSKREEEWKEIDNTFKYVFSLSKNDLVKVVKRDGCTYLGYYRGCDRNTASISLISHNGHEIWRGIGVNTLKLFEKYEVGVLGDYYKVKREKK